jgi:hypothetical protein
MQQVMPKDSSNGLMLHCLQVNKRWQRLLEFKEEVAIVKEIQPSKHSLLCFYTTKNSLICFFAIIEAL